MKNVHKIGDTKQYEVSVKEADIAEFESGVVHPFYATFALGRDAEWACRLFVLDMLESDEEGIGTFLHINHRSPALLGQKVVFKARIEQLDGSNMECSFSAFVEERLIAEGRTGQKILLKSRVEELIKRIDG